MVKDILERKEKEKTEIIEVKVKEKFNLALQIIELKSELRDRTEFSLSADRKCYIRGAMEFICARVGCGFVNSFAFLMNLLFRDRYY